MFSFVKNRYTFYAITIGLFIFSLLTPFLFRLNMGIDMTGGTQIEYTVNQGDVESIITDTRNTIIDSVKGTLDPTSQKIITDTVVYRVSGTNKFVIEAGIDEEGVTTEQVDAAKALFLSGFTKKLGEIPNTSIVESKYVNIGASFGNYIKQSGFVTLIIAIVAISLYIMYAFRGSIAGMASWPFAVVTGASLMHDVVVVFGLYVVTSAFFPEFKIDTFFITALLTVLGYSINDTIVVMDRIRSNLESGGSKKVSFSATIDKSIHDTMRRSLFTSLTVIIVLVAIFFFGPTSLRGFTLALIYGGIIGTYSSIFIASPLLIDITKKK